jgi:hypothetical protein
MAKTARAALVFVPILVTALAAAAPGQAPVSGPVVQYDIQARLVPESKTIQGRETLVWRNDSEAPVEELRFHLYMNAFKNNKTTFMTESGGAMASKPTRTAGASSTSPRSGSRTAPT